MASSQRGWRYALTIGVAGITASCAWFGAGMKSYQEHTQVRLALSHFICSSVWLTLFQERKAALQASPEQKIHNLETVRKKLSDQSVHLQRKIEALEKGTPMPTEDRGRQRS